MWSDYFEVLKSWPKGLVAANKILDNFDRGSVIAWPQPLKNPNPISMWNILF